MAESTDIKEFPWKSGMWYNKEQCGFLTVVKGETAEYTNIMVLDYPKATAMFAGKWSSGVDFGDVPDEHLEKTGGVKKFNINMNYGMFQIPGVLHENGTKIYAKSMMPGGGIDEMNCLNDEELEALKEAREPKEAPKIPDYIKPQPGKPGKLLWFSGPPGAGKSTTAQLMARNHGYIYYEADCMSIFVNPFIDVNTPEPSMAQMNQKPLKGLDEKTIASIEARSEMTAEFTTKEGMKNFDPKVIDRLFKTIADSTCIDINRQRERLGGDWTVAFAIFSRAQRDIIRKALGNEVIFLILHLSDECNKKRLHSRHGEVMDNQEEMDEMMDLFVKLYESAEEGEENAHNIMVTEDMTPEDVAKEVLNILEK